MIRIEILILDEPGQGGRVSSRAMASPTTNDREHAIANSMFSKIAEIAKEIGARPEIDEVAMIEREVRRV